jgi:hypothetical protein
VMEAFIKVQFKNPLFTKNKNFILEEQIILYNILTT